MGKIIPEPTSKEGRILWAARRCNPRFTWSLWDDPNAGLVLRAERSLKRTPYRMEQPISKRAGLSVADAIGEQAGHAARVAWWKLINGEEHPDLQRVARLAWGS